MKDLTNKINDLSIKTYLVSGSLLQSRTSFLLAGIGLLCLGLTDLAEAKVSVSLPKVDWDESHFHFARCRLFRLLEGSFGALLAVGAGIGSIIAAAVGKYAVSYTFLAVSVGSFCMRSFVSLFFGDVGQQCGEDF